jgi:hypothetical protein
MIETILLILFPLLGALLGVGLSITLIGGIWWLCMGSSPPTPITPAFRDPEKINEKFRDWDCHD